MDVEAIERRNRLIIEHCLENYPRLRDTISRRQIIQAQEIDFEFFLLAYLAMQMDGEAQAHEELFLDNFTRFLYWDFDKVESFRARAARQRSYKFSDFVFTRVYPELSVIAFKLAYAMTRIDGVVHPDEVTFLDNLKHHFFEYSFSDQTGDLALTLDNLLAGQGVSAVPAGPPSAPPSPSTPGYPATPPASGTPLSPSTPTTPGAPPASGASPASPTGQGSQPGAVTGEASSPVPEQTLEECLAELHDLVGLKPVKDEVERLVRFLQIQQRRKELDLPVQRVSLHMVFTGNPGTGKTTLGRLLARIFKAMGLLTKGHLVETDRSGLVGSYVGHTAPKTLETANKALDGFLFVDEAYALTRDSDGDFGMEAIDTLVKFMEDHRARIIVVVAGYEQEMEQFVNSNPGLKSRFATMIHFPDYTAPELLEMFKGMCEQNGYELTPEAETHLATHLEEAVARREKGFGNGRYARNLFEYALKNQAFRLIAGEQELSREDLVRLCPEDLTPPEEAG